MEYETKIKRILKRSRVLWMCLTLAVLLLGIVVFLALRQDVTYRLKSNMQAVFAPSFFMTESHAETTQMSLSDLQNDSRVTFDQSLMLINETHLLTGDFTAEICAYRDTDVLMNLCVHDAYESLAKHINDKFGQKLYIRSAYRTAEEQQEETEANADTATQVGASEHQAGLALDVYIPYYAGNAFLKTDVGRYVNTYCHEFGFIIRYPSYGKDSTGISFEPWHLRYVGFPHSEIITKHYLTLEEYVDELELGKLYAYQTYIITRQSGDNFLIPCEFQTATVSFDNTGSYILTFVLE